MTKCETARMLTLLMLVGSVLLLPGPVHADEGTPPAPIIVTREVSANNLGPNAVVPGPGGNQVTITNRYYPYWQGKVRTDGYANANFNQPSWRRMTCRSHAYNSAGQTGTSGYSSGADGGDNCPTTTPLAEVGGLVPTTSTSWTEATWYWSDDSQGYGKAEQSHSEW